MQCGSAGGGAGQQLIKAEGQLLQSASLMLQADSPSGSLFADPQVPDNGNDAGDSQPVTPQTPAMRVVRSTKSRWAWETRLLKRRAAGLLYMVSLLVETIIQWLQRSHPPQVGSIAASLLCMLLCAGQEEQVGMGSSLCRCIHYRGCEACHGVRLHSRPTLPCR